MKRRPEMPYIASPYTLGRAGVNLHRAYKAYLAVIKMGVYPYCPLLNHYLDVMEPQSEDTWMGLDMAWLRRCDSLIRLPGKSRGADMEEALAKKLRLPIFYSVAAFKAARGK